MREIKKLSIGDTIGVVAPANNIPLDDILKGKESLEKLGYKVVLGHSCTAHEFSFGGSDEVRAKDIEEMFRREDIDAIFCARGGYGSIRLLPLINFDVIKENPKIFLGFSDITSLLISINQLGGFPTFHGPMVVSNMKKDLDQETKDSLLNALTCEKEYLLSDKFDVLSSGSCSGVITGGNLAVLTSTLGTPFEIDTKGKIVFIEEIGEYTYKVDRMLNQLKQSGKFHDAIGIIIGDFNNCKKDVEADRSLVETFADVFSDLDIPIIEEFSSGHCTPMLTVPFGRKVSLDTHHRTITVLSKDNK